MKNQDKLFLFIYLFTLVLFLSAALDNFRGIGTSNKKAVMQNAEIPQQQELSEPIAPEPKAEFDSSELKQKLQNLGLTPKEAKYWKEINE